MITLVKRKVYKVPDFPVGMRSRELLEKLNSWQKPLFTPTDLAKVTNKSKAYLKVYLSRLKKKKVLREVERGKYSLSLHPYIIASNLIFPSYISFLSAYAYYQLTTQLPRRIQVVARRSKKSLPLDDYLVEFIKFPPARMFGFHKEKFMEKEVFIAEKEKAIIDSLYLPQYCPLDETQRALEEKLDLNKLTNYALRMDSIVLLKRLGYLLELRNIDIYPQVRKKLNSRYDLLDPSQPPQGQKSQKWKLTINRSFQDVE